MNQENNDPEIVLKKRGRPKKIQLLDVIEPKRRQGRQKIYQDEYNENDELIKGSVLSFQRRGYLIALMKSLKIKLYGKDEDISVLYPVKSDYYLKTNDVVMGIIKKLKLDIMNKPKHSSSKTISDSKLKKSSLAKEEMKNYMIYEHKENKIINPDIIEPDIL